MIRPVRIAILAHSTNPRGGVVHAMQLAEALADLGHDAVLHAPDAGGQGFFRTPRCAHVAIPVPSAPRDLRAMIEQRSAAYRAWFAAPAHRRFDVFHAQDGISAHALAGLREDRAIPGFARTVHHIDGFADPDIAAIQARGIRAADSLFTVSRLWRDVLATEWNRPARIVGNGVDTMRFSPVADGREASLRARLGLDGGPMLLAIGGVEARKNTLGILGGFQRLHAMRPDARLVIAGGASLLDHGAYQAGFEAALAASGLPPGTVIRSGPLPDQDMPALYRLADALAFPSLAEGFGLVVLEAMASGVPVIVPDIAPFTEYLAREDALWCAPEDASSIGAAMRAALDPGRHAALAIRGHAVAARHGWAATARAHLPGYAALTEAAHA